MGAIDVMCIGDAFTDTFIRLLDDQAHTYANEDGRWLSLPYGAKLPYDTASVKPGGGNAPNAAVSLSRLGLNSGLMSNVGDDEVGREIIKQLKIEKVDSRYVHINQHKLTNSNYVLWYKEDRTILNHHEDYDYHWPHIHKNDLPTWVYFSSLSKNSLPFHDDLSEWLDDHPDIRLAFNPGTVQINQGTSRLKKIYGRCYILILNREEAARIVEADKDNVHDLFDKLHALGPKTVVITDGPKGSYASSTDGRFFMPVYPDIGPPVERTGAGDAYASTLVAALIKGHTLEEALRWAPINSMNVVQHIGPHDGLLSEGQLVSKLKDAPTWYHANHM
jgi:sugar/nucleoside kinase (ribokinase family)